MSPLSISNKMAWKHAEGENDVLNTNAALRQHYSRTLELGCFPGYDLALGHRPHGTVNGDGRPKAAHTDP